MIETAKKKLNKKTHMIITWWIFIGTALFVGLLGLTNLDSKNNTKEDYQEIVITYERINKVSDEDPMYTIFSKDDEKSFLINNIVSHYFDKTKFDAQVDSGDTIILTVLKSDYANNTTRIKTLGVKSSDVIFMNFERAFAKDNNNGQIGYIMFLVLLPLSGVLVTAFVTWLMLYNKGIIGKKLTADERLAAKYETNMKIIKFPVSVSTIIIYIFVLLCGIALPLFFIENLNSDNLSIFIGVAVFCGVLTIFNTTSFIMRFLRKLIIDKEKRILTYFSFFKRKFEVDEILTMNNVVKENSEGENKYYLAIDTRFKQIKVLTQSDEQSILLRNEILSLRKSNEPKIEIDEDSVQNL